MKKVAAGTIGALGVIAAGFAAVTAGYRVELTGPARLYVDQVGTYTVARLTPTGRNSTAGRVVVTTLHTDFYHKRLIARWYRPRQRTVADTLDVEIACRYLSLSPRDTTIDEGDSKQHSVWCVGARDSIRLSP